MKLALQVVLALIFLVVLVLGGWALITLNYTYSEGERAGYIQKISKKGWICKTWEGELAMASLPGTLPMIFAFTVRDDAVAHEIEKLAGQRVSLTYEEHPGVPTSCFGETPHFVVKVTPIAEGALTPGLLPQAQPTQPK